MPQPPSFPFYAGDWIAGTATLGLAEKGAYIDCLAHQWTSGDGVPGDDPVALARIVRSTPAEARKVWAAIGRKFTKGDDGLYRNPRIERERETKARYYQSKSENGSKGGRPRKSDTKPIGLAPSPSPSPSEPTVQTTARATSSGPERTFRAKRPNPYAHALIQAPNGRMFWEGQIFDIPHEWARKALKASNGRVTDADLREFANDLTAKLQREGGEAPSLGFLGWLDAQWDAWRAGRRSATTSDAEARRTEATLAEYRAHEVGTPEEILEGLRAGRARR